MSCARCARLRFWLAKCSRCRARFQARNARNDTPVCSLNRCRNRDGDRPADAAQSAAVILLAEKSSSFAGAPDAMIQLAVRQRFAKAQLIEFSGGKTATPLLQPQGLVSGANSLRDIGRVSPGNSSAQILHRRGLDRFRLDHEADDARMLALNAVRHIGRNEPELADQLGLVFADLEA